MIDQDRWEETKKYLIEYDFLSVYDLAIQLNRSPATIRIWRRKLGLSRGYPFKVRPETRKKSVVSVVVDQEIWDNAEWFKEQYVDKKMGIAAIAKVIGRVSRIVVLRLSKYGIATRKHDKAVKSINPCSDIQWLMYNYATRDEYLSWAVKNGVKPDEIGGKSLSMKKCADLANVVPATVNNWLVRANREGFKINIRDSSESQVGSKNPFYGRRHTKETIERLRKITSANLKSRTKSRAKQAATPQLS
jgi:hypothetical protein